MGVNCKIMLPNNVTLSDVAKLLAMLSGQQPRKESLQGGSWSIRVDTICYRTHNFSPTCVDIEWIQPDRGIDTHYLEGGLRSVMFHLEPDHGSHRLMIPPSTAWWLAVGKRLVDFFGGELDYNDCDIPDVDYRKRKKSNQENSPENNPEWEVFQTRMYNTKPITKKEVKDMVKHASYK